VPRIHGNIKLKLDIIQPLQSGKHISKTGNILSKRLKTALKWTENWFFGLKVRRILRGRIVDPVAGQENRMMENLSDQGIHRSSQK
jgi:hypothetical protein